MFGDKDARAILHHDDAELVQFLLSRVNMTEKEWTVLKLREYDGLTIEDVAEKLDVSTRTIDNRTDVVMEKLCRCWGSTPWVRAVARDQRKKLKS